MPSQDPSALTPNARPYAEDVQAVADAFQVELASGLSEEEASRRLALTGPNALETSARAPVWQIVVRATTEPFVIMLALAGILAVVVGETRDGLLVLAGLLPIVGADVVTEYRGERALEALRDASAPTARVRRSGSITTVPAASLVPGDVVLLHVGDVVPADLRLARADQLLLDNSILTGESIPADATVRADLAGASLADRRSVAYSGASVVGGHGEGITIATAASTEVGQIAAGITSRERRRSPLQLELDRLVRILLIAAIALIIVTTGLGFFRGHSLGENVLAGISSAIAAIPEEPPVLLAVILGLGAYRLLRRRVLVRRLNAEDTLGAVDLIITDKTGTLTQNRLVVSSVRTLDGQLVYDDLRRRLLEQALRAEEDAWPQAGASPGSFTLALRAAVVEVGGRADLDPRDLLEGHPFSTERPVSRTTSLRDGAAEDLMLGAPEVVLDSIEPILGPDARGGWESLVAEATRQGERLIALAGRFDAAAWEMRALIGFSDPIRPEIGSAMRMARDAGIQVVVVTGDHPYTAAAIARRAGLPADRVVTGAELATWDDVRLAREMSELHVVARSTPDQKLRLVRIARTSGRIVAVTGDGVNDAPALHGANVSASMGSGTAVAREASDLVLGDDSFGTLMFGLLEGRRIVDNVQKGLVFIVSTHVAFLGFILLSTIAVAERQVLVPLQILWMELFIDLSTSVAFEREAPEPHLMTRSPRSTRLPLLTNAILGGIGLAGAWSAVGALALLLAQREGGFVHAAWLAYTALVIGQCVRAYWNRSLQTPIHRLRPNGFLLAACLAAAVVQLFIPVIPPVAEAFHAAPLSALDWLLIGIVSATPAAIAELVRMRSRARAWVA